MNNTFPLFREKVGMGVYLGSTPTLTLPLGGGGNVIQVNKDFR